MVNRMSQILLSDIQAYLLYPTVRVAGKYLVYDN